jgi:hypothetical protein
MTTIRRLNPDTDRGLLVDAYAWEAFAPRWFKDADKVFGPPTLVDFIKGTEQDDRATFGIFDDEIAGLIILTLRDSAVEADLMARPGVSLEIIAAGASSLRDAVFSDLPVTAIYCWLARKNYPTRKLCAIIGFCDSGLRLLKGVYRGRVIEWYRLEITREAWETEQLALAA